MWHARCQHCERMQLFGIRRLEGLKMLRPGVMQVTWSCPNCGHSNDLLTGSGLPALLMKHGLDPVELG